MKRLEQPEGLKHSLAQRHLAKTNKARMAFHSSSSRPHFFQPLIPGFENEFSIPEAFCKYLDAGVEGGRKVVLRSPLGKSYKVRVHNGRELKGGWKQFVDDHDLHVGDFLVFRLEGAMVLDVMAFDPSLVERKYHFAAPPHVSVKIETEQLPTDLVEPNTDHCTLGTPREKNAVKASLAGKSGSAGTKRPEIAKKNPTHGEKKRAEARLAGNTPTAEPNDHCFDVSIRRDLSLKNRLYLPRKFVSANGIVGKSSETVVVDGKGAKWPARLVTLQNTNAEVKLKDGWKEYVTENRLKLGDSLSVELVRGGTNPVFRITGLGRIPMENPRMNVEEVKKEPNHEESAAAEMSSRDRSLNIKVSGCALNLENEKPVHEEPAPPAAFMYPQDGTKSFVVTLTNVSIKGGYLVIPQEFAVQNGLNVVSCNVSISNEAGIPYPVTLNIIKSGTTYLGGNGWTKLVETNCLRIGDVLRFELNEAGQKPVMNFKVVSKME